jgi:hypothetical protein
VPLGSDLRNFSTAASCHIGRGNLKTLLVKVVVIHHERKREKRTTSLNPPPEKSAATSGTWVVPPTAVTLYTFAYSKEGQFRTRVGATQRTYNGQLAGKSAMNLVRFLPSFVMHVCVVGSELPSPTPPSPELNSTEVPRAPEKRRWE